MPLLDRIKYDGSARANDWVVYKANIEDIAWGSELIVGVGQEAVFVKGGKILDIFTTGTYTLETGNLPLLRGIVAKSFGGNTPFTAEVIFVNMAENLSIKWGTSSPINIDDPKYGLLLGLRSFGQYGVKVIDSRLLLNKLVGTIQLDMGFNHELIVLQFNSIINTRFKTLLMKFMTERKLSFLDIAAYYDELSELAQKIIREEFSTYGMELVSFVVESVSPPKEQYEQLRRYKEDLALGEGFYSKRRSFDIFEGMANSSAGGLVAAGFGMNMAGIGANGINQLAQNIAENTVDNKTQSTMRCGACNKVIEKGSKFCRFCGEKVPQTIFCPECGRRLEVNDKFCSGCGRKCT